MKKLILSLIVIGMSAFTFSAVADEAPKGAKCEKQECCQKHDKECCKKGKGDHKGRKGHHDGRMKLFEGLNLTDQQKEQIKEIKSACKLQRGDKGAKPSEMTDAERQAAREARAKARSEYFGKVREVLTPEQAVVFDSNVKAMEAAKAEKKFKKDGVKCDKSGKCKKDGAKKGGKGKRDKK